MYIVFSLLSMAQFPYSTIFSQLACACICVTCR